jgi:DNA mismatch repair protein MutS
MSSLKKVAEEYFDHYNRYTGEYGKNTCVLMQIGSFYEMNMLKSNDNVIGNLDVIAKLLNIQITKKNKNIESVDIKNPYMAGFPKPALQKFLPVLLDNGYTVVVIDQYDNDGKTTRAVSGIYSPSIKPLEYELDTIVSTNSLLCIFVDVYSSKTVKNVAVGIGACSINVSIGNVCLHESYINERVFEGVESKIVDEIEKYCQQYCPNEIVLHINGDTLSKDRLTATIDVPMHVHYVTKDEYKNMSDIVYQNNILRKVYKNVRFGLLEPIEYFDLACVQNANISLLYALQFVSRHDEKYVQNLQDPELQQESKYMKLELNTLDQLNVLPTKHAKRESLFDIIDKTYTTVGKRALKMLLCKPLKDVDAIKERYAYSDALADSGKENELANKLSGVIDFEKAHRKLGLQILTPCELYQLYTTYILIADVYKIIVSEVVSVYELLRDYEKLLEYISDTQKVFRMDVLEKVQYGDTFQNMDNIFQESNAHINIKELRDGIRVLEESIESLRCKVESLSKDCNKNSDWVKTSYNESEGHFFTCTKIRGNVLQKAGKDGSLGFEFKMGTSSCKITSKELMRLSSQIVKLKDAYGSAMKTAFISLTDNLYNKYNFFFTSWKLFVQDTDIALSNLKCKYLYNYCKPNVIQNKESFIDVKGLRHAIIERLDRNTNYIPNDIHLTHSQGGMILYALNSCGKSSLLRSLGLCVVMAQCGLYVPCSEMTFSPFNAIITQVDMTDNIWKGQSSFVSEMLGLKKILQRADEKTLVLSDELTKGTEVISATSIFSAAVLELVTKRSKFIFTTHLQDVAKIKDIKDESQIRICHLTVDINGDDIVFQRKLEDGPCSELYGLEIAGALGLGKNFIDKSFQIRNLLVSKTQKLVAQKRSRYNKLKIVDSCEVCGYCPGNATDIPLDVHHIAFQCTADKHNFIDHIHKNNKSNLVVLCKSCHIKVHQGALQIEGYKQTLNGIKLFYQL